jgi:hypothetical protein
MSSRAVRVGQNWTDDSKRKNSSTPGTISLGRRRSFFRTSVCRSRVSTLGDQVDRGLVADEEQKHRVLTRSPRDMRSAELLSLTIAESMLGPSCLGIVVH